MSGAEPLTVTVTLSPELREALDKLTVSVATLRTRVETLEVKARGVARGKVVWRRDPWGFVLGGHNPATPRWIFFCYSNVHMDEPIEENDTVEFEVEGSADPALREKAVNLRHVL